MNYILITKCSCLLIKAFKVFLWTFAAFSLIFSPVLVPDHLTLTDELFKHQKGS